MATASADKKGMKRICPSCSTRYYDFNKRPVTCPNCKAEFTSEIKTRARRARVVSNDLDEGQVSEDTAVGKRAPDADDEDVLLEGDEAVVSLDDLDEDEDEEIDEGEEDVDPDLDLDEGDLDDDDLDDDEDDDDDDSEDDDDDEDDEKPSRRKK